MAIKKLFKNSIVYGIANAVQKLIPVIILPIITNHLGREALKNYDVAFVYTYIFCALIILSLDSAASVFYFDQKKEKFDKRQVLSYAFYLQLISVALGLSILFGLSHFVGAGLFKSDPELNRYWHLCLWYIPGFMLFNYTLNVMLWKQMSFAYTILCVMNTVLSIAGSLAVVRFFGGTLAQLIGVQLAVITACGLTGVWLLRRDLFAKAFPVNFLLAKKLIAFGMPFALTAFFRQLIPSVDRYFLLHFHQNEQLPVYILAVKIASLFTVATNAFTLAFLPYSLDKLNQDDAVAEISNLFHAIAVLSFAGLSVLLLFKDALVLLFANETYAQAASILPILLMGWCFDLFAYFSMLGVYKSQNSRIVLIFLLLGSGIISLSNFLLVPVLGIYGAAISFLVTKVLLFFITMLALRRHFTLRIRVGSFFLFFGLATCFSFLAFRVTSLTYLLLLFPFLGFSLFELNKRIPARNLLRLLRFTR